MVTKLLSTLTLIFVVGLYVNSVSAYQVDFYHAQDRFYQNSGSNHFRVGFAIKDDDGNFLNQSNKPSSINVTSSYTPAGSTQTELTSFREGFSVYEWSSGRKTIDGWVYSDFNQENYYGARYDVLTTAGGIDVDVDLGGEIFSLQYNFTGPRALVAPDISSLRKKYADGGLLISWDPLESSASDVSMRGILTSNFGGQFKEVQARLNPTDSEMFIPELLIAQMGLTESDLTFALQMRTDDGFNRYYTDGTDVQSMPMATPVPAAAWLLGSGLIGLIGVRRRIRK